MRKVVIAMQLVFVTALVVGGATLLGAGLGFAFRRIPGALSDGVMAVSAGVMLAAAILGLVLPSLSYGGRFSLPVTIGGIFAGAFTIHRMEALLPRLQRLAGLTRKEQLAPGADSALLFVAAIILHKLPEGLAAGVGFGTDNPTDALLIAGGIALQNIPEGMVVIVPMLTSGVSVGRALACSLVTALVEMARTLIGYWAVTLVSPILPLALAFAGGTMLFVLVGQMLPQARGAGNCYAVLAGFCLMLLCDGLLG